MTFIIVNFIFLLFLKIFSKNMKNFKITKLVKYLAITII